MIYPSHYGDGNFGIDHPDTEPYKTIRAALKLSKSDLEKTRGEAVNQAEVRPWLQDFTASYLDHHISYGKKEVREQIRRFTMRATMNGFFGVPPTVIPGMPCYLRRGKKEAARIAQQRATKEEESKTAAAKTTQAPAKVQSEAEKSLEGAVEEETTRQQLESGEASEKKKKGISHLL